MKNDLYVTNSFISADTELIRRSVTEKIQKLIARCLREQTDRPEGGGKNA